MDVLRENVSLRKSRCVEKANILKKLNYKMKIEKFSLAS
jgi:hypothetical protein